LTEVDDLLAKGRSSLDAARTLFAADFPSESASRAYFAAFYAAEAALLALGETRSKHSGVISAFGSHVVRKGGLDATFGATLRSLFDVRNRADYGPGIVGADEVRTVLEDAGRFVDAVDAWIGAQSP
jgi:uncharacterized protein (UPF0332 family)